MKCDPAAIDQLLARFPGAKVMGMPSGDRVAGGGKVIGDHIASAGKLGGRRPNVRKVGPNGENKLELDFEAKILQPKLMFGEIYSYRFEARSFPLCDPAFGKATYKPDFLCVDEVGLLAFEVKGFMREAAHVRLKVFADKYRHIPLYLCRRGKGGWSVERVGKNQYQWPESSAFAARNVPTSKPIRTSDTSAAPCGTRPGTNVRNGRIRSASKLMGPKP